MTMLRDEQNLVLDVALPSTELIGSDPLISLLERSFTQFPQPALISVLTIRPLSILVFSELRTILYKAYTPSSRPVILLGPARISFDASLDIES